MDVRWSLTPEHLQGSPPPPPSHPELPTPPTSPSTPPVRHSPALNVCLLHGCPRGRRVWLKTVDSQTSSILIRRERRAGLRALRMTDVLAVPSSGWWVCGSRGELCSLRLPGLPHFHGTGSPTPPHPTLVLAIAHTCLPPSTLLPLLPPGLGLHCLSLLSTPGTGRTNALSTMRPTQRS